MPRGGSKRGERRGGRKAGVPNKATVAVQKIAGTSIKELAGAYTEDAVTTLTTIMGHPDAPAAARVAACRELLDRGHGRPPQAITADLPQVGELVALLARKVVHELHPGPTKRPTI